MKFDCQKNALILSAIFSGVLMALSKHTSRGCCSLAVISQVSQLKQVPCSRMQAKIEPSMFVTRNWYLTLLTSMPLR